MIGLSSKIQDFKNVIEAKILNDKGESIFENLEIKPHKTLKPISSAWSIIIKEIPQGPLSLLLKGKSKEKVLFRDLFVHLDLHKNTFELPSAEVWVLENTVIDNLTSVLNADIANIRELIEFESGLRFAVQKLKELITMKFEYLANPYYL